MPEKLLTIKEVQDVLGLSERTIFRLIKTDDLKGFKVGREWRFEASDLEDFIRRQRQKAEKKSKEAA